MPCANKIQTYRDDLGTVTESFLETCFVLLSTLGVGIISERNARVRRRSLRMGKQAAHGFHMAQTTNKVILFAHLTHSLLLQTFTFICTGPAEDMTVTATFNNPAVGVRPNSQIKVKIRTTGDVGTRTAFLSNFLNVFNSYF